jgi:diaminopimelate decarboxylase
MSFSEAEYRQLADRFGTPCYMYDLDDLSGRVAALRSALPVGVRLAYAVKANPSLSVVASLARQGLGADVGSGGELELSLRAGMRPGQIVFTGPGKRDDELESAVNAGIGAITLESTGELRRLEEIARRSDRRVPVLLRLAAGSVMGTATDKFGFDEPELLEAAAWAARSPWLDLRGLHAFGESNVTDAAALAEHVVATVAAARRMASFAGVQLRVVDVGGGLGIPYVDGEPPLDLAALGERLATAASTWSSDRLLRGLDLVMEPGRFLVGPVGWYVSGVLEVKIVGGQTVAIIDGGIHHLLRPALLRQTHRLRVVPRSAPGGTPGTAAALVAGPLCTGIDTFGHLPKEAKVAVGDLIVVADAGAYGFSESMPFFLSHPTPSEVVVTGGRAYLARPSMSPSRWLDDQRLVGPSGPGGHENGW